MTEAEYDADTEAEIQELADVMQVRMLGKPTTSREVIVEALNYARAHGFTIFKHDEAAE